MKTRIEICMKNFMIIFAVFIVTHQVEILKNSSMGFFKSDPLVFHEGGECISYEDPSGVEVFKTLDSAIKAINFNQWSGVSIYKADEIKLKKELKTERIEKTEEKTEMIYSIDE